MRSASVGWNTNWLTTETCSLRPALCGVQLWPPSGLLYTASPMVPARTFAGLWGSTPRVRMRKLLKSVVILLQVAPPSRVLNSDSLVATKRMSGRSEEHTSELQSRLHLVCRLLLEKKKKNR